MRWRAAIPFAVAAAVIAPVFFVMAPLPQWPSYHDFADARTILGVANFWNVVSNLPFALVGIAGVWGARRLEREERLPFAILFAAIGLVALGSGYYHLAPDNARLFWDRLPMAIGFAALVSAVIGDRISPRAGLWALAPLVIASAGAVIQWRISEERGAGDLRPYIAVQLGSLVLTALLLVVLPARKPGTAWIFAGLAAYFGAKAAESGDATIFAMGNILSGHTIKHLLAGAGTWLIYLGMRARRSARP